MLEMAIQSAKKAARPIGICGQAPSDYPEIAGYLVNAGITSISVTPDAVLRTIQTVLDEEKKAGLRSAGHPPLGLRAASGGDAE